MQPVFWQWNGFTIGTYAVWMTIGLIAATLISLSAARHYHLRSALVLDAILAAVVAGTITARLGYVIINWAYYQDHAGEIVRLWQGGLNWQAGLLGGSIGAWIVARRQPAPWLVLDALAVGLPLGIACGWIGSYFSATAYGAELYPGDRFFFLARDLPDWYGLNNPRWPTQLIGAAWALLVFGTLWLTRKKDWIAGTRYWSLILIYSLGAVLIGFTRGPDLPRWYGWRIDQIADVLWVCAGAIGLWRTQRSGKMTTVEQMHG